MAEDRLEGLRRLVDRLSDEEFAEVVAALTQSVRQGGQAERPDLAAIRARLEAAPARDYLVEGRAITSGSRWSVCHVDEVVDDDHPLGRIYVRPVRAGGLSLAEMLAHAPADLAALLAEVARLTTENAKLLASWDAVRQWAESWEMFPHTALEGLARRTASLEEERDRARDLAVRLEGEVARLQEKNQRLRDVLRQIADSFMPCPNCTAEYVGVPCPYGCEGGWIIKTSAPEMARLARKAVEEAGNGTA